MWRWRGSHNALGFDGKDGVGVVDALVARLDGVVHVFVVLGLDQVQELVGVLADDHGSVEIMRQSRLSSEKWIEIILNVGPIFLLNYKLCELHTLCILLSTAVAVTFLWSRKHR